MSRFCTRHMIVLAMVAAASAAWAAPAQAASEPSRGASSVVHRLGGAVAHGARTAAHAVVHGLTTAAHAVAHGTSVAGHAVSRTAHRVVGSSATPNEAAK